MGAVYMWLALAGLLFIIEIMTVGFGAICFALGALVSAGVAYLGLSTAWQIIVFAVISLLAFFLARPVIMKHMTRKDELKTGIDALIGRTAVVTEPIDMVKHTGRAKVDGDDWKAVTEEKGVIEVGEDVTILEVNSVILTVKRVHPRREVKSEEAATEKTE
jgi:membrane protein implicated in regulation of membrane protease activity